MSETQTRIVTIAERPDLAPIVAQWLWDAFWRQDGFSYDETLTLVAGSTSRVGPPQCFVSLLAGEPAGTASLATADLDDRPDLTPWLAGVFVAPPARGAGHATRLVGAVEQAARDAAIPALWLYTSEAERFYGRLGWRTAEYFERAGLETALMRRDLTAR